MISKGVAFFLRRPKVAFAFVATLLGISVVAYQRLNIEAYPNPIPPMIEVIVQPVGWNAEEVEKLVTIPLENGLAGMNGLDHVRSQSLFGLSDVKCYFTRDISYESARQEVMNRLLLMKLPNDLTAQLSPWSAVGEVFRYTLEGPGYTSEQLKTVQDWVVKRQLKQVPGVVDVVIFGGETKQYQVNVDPNLLRAQKLTLEQLSGALANANQNVGGQRLTLGEQSYDVRGIGAFRSLKDIEQTVLSSANGVPICVDRVATVQVGAAPRLGKVGQNEKPDVVEGIVLMKYEAETEKTLQGIHERLGLIERNHLLPPGMTIHPFYDRGELVGMTTKTVVKNMVLGMFFVSTILFLFLGQIRAALLTAMTIPLSLGFALLGLVFFHTPANLLSIGAIDFGIIVDSTVIMVESIVRHLGDPTPKSKLEKILDAAKEVAGPMGFATLIIAVSFLPLVTLQGAAGVIFAPMAYTYAFAIFGALILAFFISPACSFKWLPLQKEEKESFVMRLLHRLYQPLIHVATHHPKKALLAFVLPVSLALVLFTRLGSEFMPKLEEGNLWIRATLPASVSFEQASLAADRIRAIVRGCQTEPCADNAMRHPEIASVTSQMGRPDDGTDVTGFFNIDVFAPLYPSNLWPRGQTKEHLIETLSQELQQALPGTVFNFSQVIEDNVREAVAGVKGENSIKVIGPNLQTNQLLAQQILTTLSTIEGVKDLGMFSSLGQPTIQMIPNRFMISRYGLTTGDVTTFFETALAGRAITQFREGDRAFDVVVRFLPKYRQSIRSLQEMLVTTPTFGGVPLGQVTEIKVGDGPLTIYREDGERYTPVKFSVRGKDLASVIQKVQRKVHQTIPFPYDTRFEISGEFNELHKTERRLLWIVPLTLLLVGLLALTAVKQGLDTLLVLTNVPLACAGGIFALFLTGTHFSISAAMGFISVFGIAVQDAILLVTYFQRLHLQQGLPVLRAVQEASGKRLRSALMTILVATLGLLPAALSHEIGSQTQRPLALVVIGGSLSLAVFSRILLPSLLVLLYRWRTHKTLPVSQ